MSGPLVNVPDVGQDFYATAAQVIPVLYLALVIEQRVYAPKEGLVFGLATHGPMGPRWFIWGAGLLCFGVVGTSCSGRRWRCARFSATTTTAPCTM